MSKAELATFTRNIIRVTRQASSGTYTVVRNDGTKRYVSNLSHDAGHKQWNLYTPGEREAYDAADTLKAALMMIDNEDHIGEGKP